MLTIDRAVLRVQLIFHGFCLQNLKNAYAAFDRIVEVKDEVRRVFQDHVTGEFSLQRGAMGFQFFNYTLARGRP